jgi:hypothetical protein
MLSDNKVLARIGGALYLIVAVGGAFAEFGARGSVTVAGDAAATAANIAQHATLFRAGLVADLVDFVCFLGVGLVLYAMLKRVQPDVAVAMLVINAVSVAIQALNMLNHAGALLVATDPRFAGLSSGALFFLELHHVGYLIAQIFFGLYLLPLGYLVYRSGLFPRGLGIVLMVGSVGYVVGIVATPLAMVGGIAEMLFLVWLLVRGVSEKKAARWATA